MLTLYILKASYVELIELKSKGLKYFINVANLFDFILLLDLIGTVLGSLQLLYGI